MRFVDAVEGGSFTGLLVFLCLRRDSPEVELVEELDSSLLVLDSEEVLVEPELEEELVPL